MLAGCFWRVQRVWSELFSSCAAGVCLPSSLPAHACLPARLAVAGLAADFTFTEIGGKARDVFKMFIS